MYEEESKIHSKSNCPEITPINTSGNIFQYMPVSLSLLFQFHFVILFPKQKESLLAVL